MKIGIIVYSQTGHTLSVANRLKEELECSIEEVKANRDMKNPNVFEITNSPDISKYDLLIFGSYIEAFSLNPVMKKYLESIKINDKKCLCFVTHQLPKAWMGGNRGIKQMTKILGDNVLGTKVINWGNKDREEEINSLVSEFNEKIKGCI